MSISQRSRVIQLYKTVSSRTPAAPSIHPSIHSFIMSLAICHLSSSILIHLGRDYPQNPRGFQANVHRVFMKNRDVREEHTIEALIAQGQYVVKELEALYMLKKYRTLKRRYDRSLDP
ncbi:hypothetical protein TCAL_08804 [Tigriopus californicus]|uniref:LYR motif-containing protein 5 n=1 Tax=Tigriopus californicus TaxID=6832 RepID=A0A553P616_TIGCA|nr:hypothetical protein TCAL_08804 [Tigriopus californicus]